MRPPVRTVATSHTEPDSSVKVDPGRVGIADRLLQDLQAPTKTGVRPLHGSRQQVPETLVQLKTEPVPDPAQRAEHRPGKQHKTALRGAEERELEGPQVCPEIREGGASRPQVSESQTSTSRLLQPL